MYKLYILKYFITEHRTLFIFSGIVLIFSCVEFYEINASLSAQISKMNVIYTECGVLVLIDRVEKEVGCKIGDN